jgi:hypothetical protein
MKPGILLHALYVSLDVAAIVLLVQLVHRPVVRDGAPSSPMNSESTDAQPGTQVASTGALDEKSLRDVVRAVFEQELSRCSGMPAAAPDAIQATASTDVPVVKENSSENLLALDQVTTAVDTALARGSWLDADNRLVRPFMHELTESQRTQILEQVMGAVNRQELDIRTAAPAF